MKIENEQLDEIIKLYSEWNNINKKIAKLKIVFNKDNIEIPSDNFFDTFKEYENTGKSYYGNTMYVSQYEKYNFTPIFYTCAKKVDWDFLEPSSKGKIQYPSNT